MRAAGEGRKLRDVATEIFRRGLAETSTPSAPVRHRVELPLIECKRTSTEMTAAQVADVLLKQDMEWSHEAAGR